MKAWGWLVFAVLLLALHLPGLFFTPYAIMFLYCIGVFGYGVAKLFLLLRSLAWPAAKGQITRSSVRQGAYTDQGELGEYDYPDIAYAYEVDGRRYTGILLKSGDQYKTRWTWLAERWVARYPVGAEVVVRWNPVDPGKSLVYPRPVAPWLLPLSGGLLFAVVAATMFKDAFEQNPEFHRWNFLALAVGVAMFAFAAIMSRGDADGRRSGKPREEP